MLCEKEVRRELKRLPGLRRKAASKGDWVEAFELTKLIEFIEWILTDCECKEKS